jgi:tellurite resistance protein TehA-like permease
MNEPEKALAAIEAAASNPKVATAIAASTAAAGGALKLELVQSVIGTMSLAIGMLTGAVVLAIQLIKLIRVWKAWQADAPEPEDLK